MRIISKKRIRDFCIQHPRSEISLTEWYYKMKASIATDCNDLKKMFNSVDYINGYTIFDVGGNNYRLIASIHYKGQRCYIRKIWTHAEYTKHQDQLKRGNL